MPSTSAPIRARFGIEFVLLARRWRRALDRRLAAMGLSDATWPPLIHLQESGDGISQKDLAALVGIDGSSLVRLLDILVARGLVERRPDARDRRAKLIFLTGAGHAALQKIGWKLSRGEADMLADVTDAEIATTLDVFARIDRRLRDAPA
ncbi:MarR family winged helix-turn-helix transcriptional regulator [Neoroseomonas soli]|uniref:MarR family transcriptional regulator n=1 Tax=Neoroseomonas soli TaxID=1081025 RepID=A0A9X9X3B9_9PROT|nr:MarR family transcriptional regulator [Neoroseomonas soli]MBR0673898.1 MarR family transcriptional regulator [Neoroseomonas soli]